MGYPLFLLSLYMKKVDNLFFVYRNEDKYE